MDDYLTIENNWHTHIADTLTVVNAQGPDTFVTTFSLLDAMMASFMITR